MQEEGSVADPRPVPSGLSYGRDGKIAVVDAPALYVPKRSCCEQSRCWVQSLILCPKGLGGGGPLDEAAGASAFLSARDGCIALPSDIQHTPRASGAGSSQQGGMPLVIGWHDMEGMLGSSGVLSQLHRGTLDQLT